jgi:hypothetical protein
MEHGWGNHAYEVVLARAATRVIERLPKPSLDRLARALRTELADGPNARNAVRLSQGLTWADDDPGDLEEQVYTATPLSFDGYTAVHRLMTKTEIERLGEQEDRRTASTGFFVVNLLPAESAFRPWPPHA